MDIYNKAIPYDIFNTSKFSDEKFNSSNLITMKLGTFDEQEFYTFSIILRNTSLCEKTQNIIKQLLLNCINSEIEISNSSILVTADVSNLIDGNNELSNLIKNILKILLNYNYIQNDTFFGISYDYDDKLYNGYLTQLDFFI